MNYRLLTQNSKMRKSEPFGYSSFSLNLQSNYQHEGQNTCPWSGKCAGTCLSKAGMNRFSNVWRSREAKTKLFFENKELFLKLLWSELSRIETLYAFPTVRLNGLSDIPWEFYKHEGKNPYEAFPGIGS